MSSEVSKETLGNRPPNPQSCESAPPPPQENAQKTDIVKYSAGRGSDFRLDSGCFQGTRELPTPGILPSVLNPQSSGCCRALRWGQCACCGVLSNVLFSVAHGDV